MILYILIIAVIC